MKYFIAFVLLLSAVVVEAQVDLDPKPHRPIESPINGQKVSFTRFLLEMEKAKGWTVFRDLKIVYNYDEDKFFGMDEWFLKKNKVLHFTASHIGIYNCEFDEEFWLVLSGAVFAGHFSMVGCAGVKVVFDNCTFRESLRLHANAFEFAKFVDCRFELGFRFTRGTVSDNLTFSRCVFDYNSALIGIGGGFDMDDRLFFISNKIDGIDLIIDSCLFKKNLALQTTRSFVDLSESQFKNVIIQNSEFETGINLERTVVAGYLDLSNNIVKGGIFPNGMTYNFNNSTIIWDDLKGNTISIYDEKQDLILNKENVNEPYDDKRFNKIVSSYTAIFNAFKSQGNKAWANDCYKQWKEIETEGYLKRRDYTSYTLNIFLAIFCDYGTNPIKAAKYSVLIIFFFSIIYLFIPFHEISTQTKRHKRRATLIGKAKKSRSDYVGLYRSGLSTAATKKALKRNKYSTALKIWLFGILEQLGNSTFNKRLSGVPLKCIFGAMSIGNSLDYYISKLFHALILSMNAFVTLGFGSMKVKGDYIYLSIIEGVIGWFLLSIFTVSLINQIINW